MHRSILVTFRSRGKPPLPTTTPAVVSTVHVEKSQLAAMWSEMAMFESSGKRGRGLELVCRHLIARYLAVISRRRKSVFRRWRLMHESAIDS